jgi:hypothetical protein
LLVELWAGLQLPRELLNAKDVPLPEAAPPPNLSLLGVIRLNAKRHEALSHPLLLIDFPRVHGFGK